MKIKRPLYISNNIDKVMYSYLLINLFIYFVKQYNMQKFARQKYDENGYSQGIRMDAKVTPYDQYTYGLITMEDHLPNGRART